MQINDSFIDGEVERTVHFDADEPDERAMLVVKLTGEGIIIDLYGGEHYTEPLGTFSHTYEEVAGGGLLA